MVHGPWSGVPDLLYNQKRAAKKNALLEAARLSHSLAGPGEWSDVVFPATESSGETSLRTPSHKDEDPDEGGVGETSSNPSKDCARDVMRDSLIRSIGKPNSGP